jgi:hypothetical protein
VVFGSSVTFDREDGRRQTFRIVGEDEGRRAGFGVLRVTTGVRSPLAKVSAMSQLLLGRRCRWLPLSKPVRRPVDPVNHRMPARQLRAAGSRRAALVR